MHQLGGYGKGVDHWCQANEIIKVWGDITDPTTPKVSLDQATYSLGELGTVDVKFSLDNAAPYTVELTYTIAYDGLAAASDIASAVATTGTVTWAIGEEGLKTVSIAAENDNIVEGDETMTITITSVIAVEATSLPSPAIDNAKSDATLTITDPGEGITASVSITETQEEGSLGTATITLSHEVAADYVVDWVIEGTGDFPLSAADFASASGSATVPANSLTGTFTIDITSDSLIEGVETGHLKLVTRAATGGFQAYTVSGSAANLSVDDTTPLDITYSQNVVGEEGADKTMTFEAYLSNPSEYTFVVDSIASNCDSPSTVCKFTIAPGFSVSAGATTIPITAAMKNDDVQGVNEKVEAVFIVTASLKSGTATQSITVPTINQATGVITDDEGAEVTVAYTVPVTGNVDETSPATIVVNLSHEVVVDVDVTLAIVCEDSSAVLGGYNCATACAAGGMDGVDSADQRALTVHYCPKSCDNCPSTAPGGASYFATVAIPAGQLSTVAELISATDAVNERTATYGVVVDTATAKSTVNTVVLAAISTGATTVTVSVEESTPTTIAVAAGSFGSLDVSLSTVVDVDVEVSGTCVDVDAAGNAVTNARQQYSGFGSAGEWTVTVATGDTAGVFSFTPALDTTNVRQTDYLKCTATSFSTIVGSKIYTTERSSISINAAAATFTIASNVQFALSATVDNSENSALLKLREGASGTVTVSMTPVLAATTLTVSCSRTDATCNQEIAVEALTTEVSVTISASADGVYEANPDVSSFTIAVGGIPMGDSTSTSDVKSLQLDIENATHSPTSSPTTSPTAEPHVCGKYCFGEPPAHFVDENGKKCYCTADCLDWNDCCGGKTNFLEECGSTCSGEHACKSTEPQLSGCYCDLACEELGDCCADHSEHCRSEAGDLNSCKLGCGWINVGFKRYNTDAEGVETECFCDHQCVEFGDCCADYEEECSEKCLPTGTCFCDAECVAYDDCCDEFFRGVHAGMSCERRCGIEGCDLDRITTDEAQAGCTELGDCLFDFVVACEATCAGRCNAYDKDAFCQCDNGCEQYGDCCPDRGNVYVPEC